MNFWTFLDRNGFGLGFLVLMAMCFGFGTCGDGKGCRFHGATPDGTITISPSDGGAP